MALPAFLNWRWALVSSMTLLVFFFGMREMGFVGGPPPPPPGHLRQYLWDDSKGWMRYDKAQSAWEKAPGPPLRFSGGQDRILTEQVTETVREVSTVQHTLILDSPTDGPIPYAHFPRPQDTPSRESDLQDSFAEYAGRSRCGVSSTDLHLPFSPLCATRAEVLDAMSSGGRAGVDQPYIPFGCDMRWYSTAEAVKIVNRFSTILFLGDSIHRHLVQALYIILRADLEFGGIADWDIQQVLDEARAKGETNTPRLRDDCACSPQFAIHACSNAAIFDSEHLWGNSSASRLPFTPFDLETRLLMLWMNQWPFQDADLESITNALPTSRPDKPVAVIVHNTLWNDVKIDETISALKDWERALAKVPWLENISRAPSSALPRLFTTINVGGLTKSLGYVSSQGNQQLGNFENQIKSQAPQHGYEVLGMYNMSIQSTQPDGTHASYETNLIKAQMVLNWLDRVDVDSWTDAK